MRKITILYDFNIMADAKVDKIDYEKDWSTAPGYYFWAPDEVKSLPRSGRGHTDGKYRNEG